MSFLGLVWQWFADSTHWQGSGGVPTRLVEHLHLSVEAVLIGAVIALPIGIALGHYGRFGTLAMNISNTGRAVPSFGLLVLAFQIFGLGDGPIILALTALAIPPMVTNSYVALREVDPDIKEAARGMGYRELAQVLPHPVSLDGFVGEDQDTRLSDIVADENATSLESAAENRLLADRIRDTLETLTPRERRVIERRFGLGDDKDESLTAIGREIGLTRERIRQIESTALRKLRHPSRAKRLRGFHLG